MQSETKANKSASNCGERPCLHSALLPVMDELDVLQNNDRADVRRDLMQFRRS